MQLQRQAARLIVHHIHWASCLSVCGCTPYGFSFRSATIATIRSNCTKRTPFGTSLSRMGFSFCPVLQALKKERVQQEPGAGQRQRIHWLMYRESMAAKRCILGLQPLDAEKVGIYRSKRKRARKDKIERSEGVSAATEELDDGRKGCMRRFLRPKRATRHFRH